MLSLFSTKLIRRSREDYEYYQLTPGDFAARRKAAITGQADDLEALIEMLHAECETKPVRSKSVGFLV